MTMLNYTLLFKCNKINILIIIYILCVETIKMKRMHIFKEM
jgi:hypothetical protein